MELTPRKKQILKAVIDSYIATGEPVGSKAVAAILSPRCSSATVRNEMGELEEMGYLTHPHTSAGRIPTHRGFRLYVDSLMSEYHLSFEETLLMNSLLSDRIREADKILSDMTSLLARMTDCTVVSLSRESAGTIEKFEGVFISLESFLLVMITSSGRAITKQLRSDFPIPPEGVEFIIGVLNDQLAKKELGSVTLERMIALENSLGEYRAVIGQIIKVIYDVMAQMGHYSAEIRGIANLFRYEEFADPQRAGLLIEQLEKKEELAAKLTGDISPTLRVHIGSEKNGLDGTSFVTCPFRMGKKLNGLVCIIGPKRMNYAKIVAKLEYLARQINAAHGFEPTLPLIETRETHGNEE